MCKALIAINSKNYERFLSEIELYSGRIIEILKNIHSSNSVNIIS